MNNIPFKIAISNENLLWEIGFSKLLVQFPVHVYSLDLIKDQNDEQDLICLMEEELEKFSNSIIESFKKIKEKVLIIKNNGLNSLPYIEEFQNVYPPQKALKFIEECVREKYEKIEGNSEYESEFYLFELNRKLIHDINNKLSSIFVNARLLKECKDEEEFITDYKKLEHSLIKLQGLVNNFQSFYYLQDVRKNQEDLNQNINQIIKEKNNQIKSNVLKFTFLYDPNLPFVRINKVLFYKLVSNIFDFVLINCHELQSINIQTKKVQQYILVSFQLQCSNIYFNSLEQIFNPFYPEKIINEKVCLFIRRRINQIEKINVFQKSEEKFISIILIIEREGE